MKKKIVEKHLFRIILIAALLSVSALGVVAVGNKSAWSQEVSEPGMGVPDEEADRILGLMESGMSFEEAYNQSYEEFYGDEYRASQSESKTSNNEVSEVQTHASSNATTDTQKTEPKAETQPQPKPVKVYEHDFDAITDEARDNFIHFSEDGTPESMYLNIAAESAMNDITGRELNATKTGNEIGTVNYVDGDGNVLYSWVFENWQSEDDFYLDLSVYLSAYTSEELVAAYSLSLQDVTLPEGNTVKLKVQSPYADGTVANIYSDEAGQLKDTGNTLTVTNGYITFEFKDAIVSPILSPETLVVKTEEKADEAKEDVSKDAVVAEAAPTEEVVEAVLETETETALASNPETAQNNTKYIIGVICAVLVAAVGIFAVYKKRRVK